MTRHSHALGILRAANRRIEAISGRPATLAPGRACATPLDEIGEQLLGGDVAVETASEFAVALSDVVDAQIENFPENLFWDFDYAASRLLSVAVAHGVAPLLSSSARIVGLQQAFGARSKIQFRYAHDFMYGFDWARWVQKDPERRSSVAPFDEPFVAHMARRGREILGLIAEHDAKYPELPRGVARNPFGFRRDPEGEERLHRDLAERGFIPVEAWRFDARPGWDRPYSALREERARALGLWTG